MAGARSGAGVLPGRRWVWLLLALVLPVVVLALDVGLTMAVQSGVPAVGSGVGSLPGFEPMVTGTVEDVVLTTEVCTTVDDGRDPEAMVTDDDPPPERVCTDDGPLHGRAQVLRPGGEPGYGTGLQLPADVEVWIGTRTFHRRGALEDIAVGARVEAWPDSCRRSYPGSCSGTTDVLVLTD